MIWLELSDSLLNAGDSGAKTRLLLAKSSSFHLLDRLFTPLLLCSARCDTARGANLGFLRRARRLNYCVYSVFYAVLFARYLLLFMLCQAEIGDLIAAWFWLNL